MLNALLKQKVSFKIQTVCQYSVIIEAKNKEERIRDNVLRSLFGDDEDIGAEHNFVSSKSVSSSLDSLDDTLQAQKLEVKEKIETEFESNPITRIEKIIIVVYQTKKSRGSSYIPTPLQYNNSRCGLINIKNEDDKCFYWCMKYHSSKQEKQ